MLTLGLTGNLHCVSYFHKTYRQGLLMRSACLKLVQSLGESEGSPDCDEPGAEFDH